MTITQILKAIRKRKIENIFDIKDNITFEYDFNSYKFKFKLYFNRKNDLENSLISIKFKNKELKAKNFLNYFSFPLVRHLESVLSLIESVYFFREYELYKEVLDILDKEPFRTQWIISKQTNFKNINMKFVYKHPILNLWFFKNIKKDNEEKIEEKKIDLMFTNPQLYNEIFSKAQELSSPYESDVVKKALETYRLKKMAKKMKKENG